MSLQIKTKVGTLFLKDYAKVTAQPKVNNGMVTSQFIDHQIS